MVESEFAPQCDPDDPALAGRPESGMMFGISGSRQGLPMKIRCLRRSMILQNEAAS